MPAEPAQKTQPYVQVTMYLPDGPAGPALGSDMPGRVFPPAPAQPPQGVSKAPEPQPSQPAQLYNQVTM
jgi:hypothetical protein